MQEEQRQPKLTGWKDLQRRAEQSDVHHGWDPVKQEKMGSPTIFSCRRIVLKVFLLQFIAFQATYAAPSPIIRFPGDDTTPKTDKEVALVSLFFLKKKKKKESDNCWISVCTPEVIRAELLGDFFLFFFLSTLFIYFHHFSDVFFVSPPPAALSE